MEKERAVASLSVGRFFKRLGIGLGLVVFAATAWIYGASQWILVRGREAPLGAITLPVAADALAEGRRFAVLIGCLEGCHGPTGEGGEESVEGVFAATAPTLSAVLPDYGDPELVRLIRYGVKRDGRTAVGMPAATFYPLGNDDLARVIAHLRQLPRVQPVPRRRDVYLLGRLALALGEWKVSADAVDPGRPRWGELPRSTPFERGRYLASVVCSECHGLDYGGDPYFPSPPLTVVKAYDISQFKHLMRTGEPLDGRDLGLMGRVSRAAFVAFTEREAEDLHAFLTSTDR
jgi:mono/diheme cytochrome c family protein